MKTIFYDVDTQNDFMNKNGALYVPGAEDIKDNLQKLTQYAVDNKINIIASADRHFGNEPELQKNGGPFPDHCMDGMYGEMKIRETTTRNKGFIENKPYTTEDYETMLKAEQVILEKQDYDIATNPNFAGIMKFIKPKNAIVYGVATDYCVKAAVLGFRKLGIGVYVVEDAIAAVDVNPGDGKKALEDMVNAGAKKINTEQVLAGDYL